MAILFSKFFHFFDRFFAFLPLNAPRNPIGDSITRLILKIFQKKARLFCGDMIQ